LRAFLESHASSEKVLDIGGGHIEKNHSYEGLFPDRFTVDIDPERQPDLVSDVHALQIEDESFGMILCTEVLEHLHTPQQAIAEMYRVLRPGGKLVLTTRFMYPLHDVPHDYFRYTQYGLEHLFQDWADVTVRPESESLTAIAAILQRVLFQTDLKGGKLTKGVLYLLVKLFQKGDWFLKHEYGDIERKTSVSPFMTTGYYVVAKKPS